MARGRSSSNTARPSIRRMRATSARWPMRCSTSWAPTSPSPAPPSRRMAAPSIWAISSSAAISSPTVPCATIRSPRCVMPISCACWARQTPHKVGLVPYRTVKQGAPAIAEAFATLEAQGIRHAIVDAVEDKDLENIGAASSALPLITGGSGVAIGLPANYRMARLIPKREGAAAAGDGGRPRHRALRLLLGCNAGPGGALRGQASGPCHRPAGAGQRTRRRPSPPSSPGPRTKLKSGPALIYASRPAGQGRRRAGAVRAREGGRDDRARHRRARRGAWPPRACAAS